MEIGAGAGWQARTLTERGFSVAIDVQDGAYAPDRVWSVIEYDGTHIPFPDHHFDIVFSSNVLEHIPHVKEFQVEIKRVLKPGGRAIHVLHTGWIVETCYPTRLLYTGFLILGSGLSIEVRHIGSYILGSACHVFALRNRGW